MATNFVIPETDCEISEYMRKAFSILKENDVQPTWIDQDKCLKVTQRLKTTFFVCDPFSGRAFNHLKDLKCRVISPLCILYCLEKNVSIPNLPYPVYNNAMNGILVCCTNITIEDRRKLFDKVQLMGGQTSGTFTERVTHLIADEVGSKKYHVAINYKTPVMLTEWVWQCWEMSQKKNVSATDPIFDRYRCPIFKGLLITVTQFDGDERKEVQRLIEENGGTYSGDLRINSTTHLIAFEAKGQKYTFAKQWKVHCVTPSWLYESIKKGYALDESLHSLEKEPTASLTTSSPQKKLSAVRDMPFLSTSAISVISPVSNVNETVASLEGSFLKTNNDNKLIVTSLNNLDMQTVYKAGSFLDGCKIFLSGFDNNEVEKLRRVINLGGGTRLNQICDAVSHCIMKFKDDDHIAKIQEEKVRPFVVSVDWLVDSCRAGYVIDETAYELWRPQTGVPDKDKSMDKKITEDITVFEPGVDEEEILSQYLDPPSQATLEDELLMKAVNEMEVGCNLSKNSNKSKKEDTFYDNKFELENEKNEMENCAEDNIQLEDCLDNQENGEVDIDLDENENGVFKKLTFLIADFNDNDYPLVSEMITVNGGMIITDSSYKKPDFIVVPLVRAESDFLVGQVVTLNWLEACLEASKLVNLTDEIIFTPVYCNLDSKPLKGCMLTLSQFSGYQRKSLIELAETLGGKCQEVLVRRTDPKKGLVATSHLLCILPNGSKYSGAVKWGLKVVNKEWLLDCAKYNRWMPEKNYSIGEANCSSIEENGQRFNNDATLPRTPKKQTPKKNMSYIESASSSNSIRSETLTESSFQNQNDVTSSTPITVKKKKRSLERSIDSLRQMFTPQKASKLRNNRIQKLIEDNRPVNTPDSVGSSTPSHFLNSNTKYIPTFSFPVSPEVKRVRPSRESVDAMDEFFYQNLRSAVSKTKSSGPFSERNDLILEDVESEDKINGPLNGVVVVVSKKLKIRQAELKKMVIALGGECKWNFDESCTHFVYQGKPSGSCEDYKLATKLKKKIVAPNWIQSCFDQHKCLDESCFPPTFNPNKSLNVTIEKTPKLSSVKKKLVNEEPFSSDLNETLDDDTNTSSNSDEYRCVLKRQMEEILTEKSVSDAKKKQRSESSSSISDDVLSGKKLTQQSQTIRWDDVSDKRNSELISAQLAKESQTILVERNLENDFNEQAKIEESISPKRLKTDKKNYVIMLSGFLNEERLAYSKLISELGGVVADAQFFNKDSTHLVANAPTRNEKFLASIASGKWILHKSFLEQSRQENRFVDEELHEWGGEGTELILAKANPQVVLIAKSARKWRMKLQNDENSPKAFSGWKCILYTEASRMASFRRLLEAGDAEISNSEFPFSDPDCATHAFIEIAHAPQSGVDFEALVEAKVMCLRFEYIAAFLMDQNLPSAEQFYIPEVAKMLNSTPKKKSSSLSKRKLRGENKTKSVH